jgi:hypothetical protein
MAKPLRDALIAASCWAACIAPAHASTVVDRPAPASAAELMDAAPAANQTIAARPTPRTEDAFESALAAYTPDWIAPNGHDIAVFLDAFLKGAGLLVLVYAFMQRRLFLGGRRR